MQIRRLCLPKFSEKNYDAVVTRLTVQELVMCQRVKVRGIYNQEVY